MVVVGLFSKPMYPALFLKGYIGTIFISYSTTLWTFWLSVQIIIDLTRSTISFMEMKLYLGKMNLVDLSLRKTLITL